MENLDLIKDTIMALREYEAALPNGHPNILYIVGQRHSLEYVLQYLKGNKEMLERLMKPAMLDKIHPVLKDIITQLHPMRGAGNTNPYLRFRFRDKNYKDRSWYPVEYDGEYRLWGYQSLPDYAGLSTFYIQELPQELELDTEFEPRFLIELIGEHHEA